jgi:hypothetical protein
MSSSCLGLRLRNGLLGVKLPPGVDAVDASLGVGLIKGIIPTGLVAGVLDPSCRVLGKTLVKIGCGRIMILLLPLSEAVVSEVASGPLDGPPVGAPLIFGSAAFPLSSCDRPLNSDWYLSLNRGNGSSEQSANTFKDLVPATIPRTELRGVRSPVGCFVRGEAC